MSEWRDFPLSELVRFRNGKSTKGVDAGDFPIYGSNGIIGGAADFLYENAIILGRVGAYCGSVEFCAGKFWATDNTIVVEPVSELLDVRFAAHMLRLANLNRYAGGAAQPLLTQTNIKGLPFTVPSHRTQQRIASILGAYDDLIEVNRRRVAVLEEMARGLFEEWFVRFRFPGHEVVPIHDTPDGPLPEGWTIVALSEFGRVLTGKTPSKAEPEYFGSDLPFVKIPDMHGAMFIHQTAESLSTQGAASQANKTVPAGSLCVSCIGTIGLVSITSTPCQTNQQINTLVPVNSYWLEYLYFTLSNLKAHLVNLGSNGATMGNVNKQKFEGIRLRSPPLTLVRQYHDLAGPMLSLMSTISLANQRLASSRDVLLPRLISGQLSVADAERELEDVA